MSEFDPASTEKVLRKDIKRIIEARVEEIFSLVDKELKKINRNSKLPAGIVLTGGGAKLNGIINISKKVCKLPTELGGVQNINSVIDKIDDPAFSTAIGLVMLGSKYEQEELGSKRKNKKNHFKFFGSIKNFFNKMMPS